MEEHEAGEPVKVVLAFTTTSNEMPARLDTDQLKKCGHHNQATAAAAAVNDGVVLRNASVPYKRQGLSAAWLYTVVFCEKKTHTASQTGHCFGTALTATTLQPVPNDVANDDVKEGRP